MPLKQVKQYQVSRWLSGSLIVQIFPPICFQKQGQLNKRGMIARFDFRKEAPPISLLGNSVHFLLAAHGCLLGKLPTSFVNKIYLLHDSKFISQRLGTPEFPLNDFIILGVGLGPSIWNTLGSEETLRESHAPTGLEFRAFVQRGPFGGRQSN